MPAGTPTQVCNLSFLFGQATGQLLAGCPRSKIDDAVLLINTSCIDTQPHNAQDNVLKWGRLLVYVPSLLCCNA